MTNIGSMVMTKSTEREKEVKLLHLDSEQREVLSEIIEQFIHSRKITPKEAVEAYVEYIVRLVEAAASGAKDFMDDVGGLSHNAEVHINKFVEALALCAGYKINSYKILNSIQIKEVLHKAAAPRNRLTIQNVNELEYKIKTMSFSMLDIEENEFETYISDTEEKYLTSLTSINPTLMKNAFIEHVVNLMISNKEGALDDIMHLASKYSKYLGTEALSKEAVENLMQRFSDVEKHRGSGLVHAARIEVFKILEGESNA